MKMACFLCVRQQTRQKPTNENPVQFSKCDIELNPVPEAETEASPHLPATALSSPSSSPSTIEHVNDLDVETDGDALPTVQVQTAENVYVADKISFHTFHHEELLQKLEEQARNIQTLCQTLSQQTSSVDPPLALRDLLETMESRQRDIQTDAETQIINARTELARLQQIIGELRLAPTAKPPTATLKCTIL